MSETGPNPALTATLTLFRALPLQDCERPDSPQHLQVGTRITHHGRGPGTVVLLREQFPPTIFVEYDAGDVHGHKENRGISSPMSPTTRCAGGDRTATTRRRKMYNEGQLERCGSQTTRSAGRRCTGSSARAGTTRRRAAYHPLTPIPRPATRTLLTPQPPPRAPPARRAVPSFVSSCSRRRPSPTP